MSNSLAGKKVYVVRGSEDGVIAVYTNAKGAVDRVFQYASYEPDKYPCQQTKNQLLLDLRKHGSCYGTNASNFASCEAELFYMEK